MWRLIFLGFIVYLVIIMFKRYYLSKHDDQQVTTDSPSTQQEIEDMVQCQACKVHLLRSESFMVNGQFYCSKAHSPK